MDALHFNIKIPRKYPRKPSVSSSRDAKLGPLRHVCLCRSSRATRGASSPASVDQKPSEPAKSPRNTDEANEALRGTHLWYLNKHVGRSAVLARQSPPVKSSCQRAETSSAVSCISKSPQVYRASYRGYEAFLSKPTSPRWSKDQKPTTHKAHRCSRWMRRHCARHCSRAEANPLEGDLLALEAAATAATTTSTEPAPATTAVTESTTSTAAAAPATEAATTATATTAAAEAAAAAAVVVAGLGIVEAHLATLNGLAVQRLESLLGIIDRRECDVAEALGATRLTGRQLAYTYLEVTCPSKAKTHGSVGRRRL